MAVAQLCVLFYTFRERTQSLPKYPPCLYQQGACFNKLRFFSLAERFRARRKWFDYIVRKRRRFNTSWRLAAKFSVTCVLNYFT